MYLYIDRPTGRESFQYLGITTDPFAEGCFSVQPITLNRYHSQFIQTLRLSRPRDRPEHGRPTLYPDFWFYGLQSHFADFHAASYTADLIVWMYSFFPEFTTIPEDIMNAKPRKNTQQLQSDFQFVNFKLSPENRSELEAWWKKNETKIMDLVQDCADNGYKMSISPDLENACYICTLIGTKNCTDNTGKGLTSRSDSVIEALVMSLYKHFVIFDGGEWDVPAEDRNWG